MGLDMLAISHERQGTVSASETGPQCWSRQGACVCGWMETIIDFYLYFGLFALRLLLTEAHRQPSFLFADALFGMC